MVTEFLMSDNVIWLQSWAVSSLADPASNTLIYVIWTLYLRTDIIE